MEISEDPARSGVNKKAFLQKRTVKTIPRIVLTIIIVMTVIIIIAIIARIIEILIVELQQYSTSTNASNNTCKVW